jgi:hypothetical protein
MKKIALAIAMALALYGASRAADAVEPANTTYNSIRGEAVGAVPGGQYYQGTTLLLTNCICFSDTSGIVTQGLGDVSVTLTVGNSSSNVEYSATTYASGGDAVTNMWTATITVIDGETTQNLQLKLEDVSGNIYIYPWKILQNKASL